MNKKAFCLIFLISAFVFTFINADLLSQKKNTAGQEVINLIKTADDAKGKKSGAIIILKEYNSSLNENAENILTLRVVGKIYNNKALDDYSHIPLAFNSRYEEANLDFARVIRSDGTSIEVNKDAVQIKTSPYTNGDTCYSDTRYLTFALAGLEIGAAFEYQYEIVQKRPIFQGEWFNQYFLGGMLQKLTPPFIPRIDPVQTTSLKLTIPKELPINYHFSSFQTEPHITRVQDQDTYTWQIKDIPGLSIESSMPQVSSLNPVFTVTTLKSWAQLNKWLTKSFFEGIEVSPEIINKAQEFTGESLTKAEKIKAVKDYIQNNIRYVNADIDWGGFTPHPLSEIINSQYGDCKDRSILFISLLKCLGIEAFPVFVNPYPQNEISDVPVLKFTHLITVVPGEKDSLWQDLTSQVTPFPELSFADQHRKALIVDGKSDKLVTTPRVNTANASFRNIFSFKGNDAICSISIEASGSISEALKTLCISAGDENMKDLFQSLVKNYIENAQVDSIIFPGLQDNETKFNTLIFLHIASVWKKGDPSFTFRSLSQLPLALLAGLDSRSMPERRENDIIPGFPFKIQSSEIYCPTDKFMIPVSLPPADSIKNDFFEFKRSSYSSKSGIIANWELQYKGHTVAHEEYKSYVTVIKKLQEMASWNIDIVNPLIIEKNLQDENPFNVRRKSEDILKNDSLNIFALLLKGMSFDKRGMTDSSIMVYSKVLSTDPENKYAHYLIATPLFAQNMNSEALSHLETALKIDPAFNEAYSTLGDWYTKENQQEKATAFFKKSTVENPQITEAWKFYALFTAQEGKFAESIEYFKTAISLDSTNSDLHSLLSESYMELQSYSDAAESLKKAISLSPDNAKLYENLARTYYMLSDNKKCIEFSKKAIEIDPKLYYARFNIALANLRSGNISEAFRLYNELRTERSRIPSMNIIAALRDLDDLVAKGLRVKEANSIIRSYNNN